MSPSANRCRSPSKICARRFRYLSTWSARAPPLNPVVWNWLSTLRVSSTPAQLLAELAVETHSGNLTWNRPTKNSILWTLEISGCRFQLNQKLGTLNLSWQNGENWIDYEIPYLEADTQPLIDALENDINQYVVDECHALCYDGTPLEEYHPGMGPIHDACINALKCLRRHPRMDNK